MAVQLSLPHVMESPPTRVKTIPKIPLTAAEYFAGIGLVRLGLERAGWRVVFANDFDPQKYEMYASYFPRMVRRRCSGVSGSMRCLGSAIIGPV